MEIDKINEELKENTEKEIKDKKHDVDLNIENFNGPLDLLLSLVKEKNVDIFEINLAELATDYLRIIDRIKDSHFEIASDYLVMAATLIQIKAKMLLAEKDEVIKQEIEEDKEKLLRLLAEYQQFKPIFQLLREQEEKRSKIFIKKPSDLEEFIRPIDRTKVDGNSSKQKITQILTLMFERIHAEKLRQIKIDSVSVTPSDQIKMIRELFKENKVLTFEMVFSVPSIKHFVITLIALLDMSRKEEVILKQEQQFATISIEKGPNYEK
ncbi:segregation/condensation protein A [Mesomycoplasma molare]|uniref:Segregation and condensation protein A n=1 Tax=Mesomycoplasma molare TaxID=171288 RepID=A0ABY5TTV0_9BACT|nr:segregation/condensation protein A [Mesomycoplasma molare]UWD34092.1 segregation/condensation protein A [Mesomycoplasma molare]